MNINLFLVLVGKGIARTVQFLVSVGFGALLGFLVWQNITEPSIHNSNLLRDWTMMIIFIVLIANIIVELFLHYIDKKIEEYSS